MGVLGTFNEIEGRMATKPRHVREIIKHILRTSEAYDEMEEYLLPKGKRGSRFYDQASAIDILRKHDNGNALLQTGMDDRMLWQELSKALQQSGLMMSHGRIVGLLEAPNGKGATPEMEAESEDSD